MSCAFLPLLSFPPPRAPGFAYVAPRPGSNHPTNPSSPDSAAKPVMASGSLWDEAAGVERKPGALSCHFTPDSPA